MSTLTPEQQHDKDMRRALFTICKTKEDLHTWIKVFIGLDFPDTIVDENSSSSPMDAIWEVYSKALANNDPNFSRTMWVASRDSFKCRVQGTKLIARDRGLVNIEDINVGDVIWSGKAWRKVTYWVDDGVKAATTVKLKGGTEHVSSPIHRYWAWSPGDTTPSWKVSSELTPSDYVMIDTSSPWGKSEVNQEEFDIGYLCGALQGDGGTSVMDTHGAVFMTGLPGKPTDSFLKFCLKHGKTPKKQYQFENSRAFTVSIGAKAATDELRSYGVRAGRSWEKDVPDIVWKSKSYAAGFVTGLFDTDGSYGARKDIIFQLTAEKMLRQLQILLLAMGVNCQYRPSGRLHPKQKHLVHHLIVSQCDIPSLLAAGVRLEKGNKAGEANLAPKNVNVHDSLPRGLISGFLALLPTDGTNKGRAMRKPSISNYRTTSRAKLNALVNYGEAVGSLSSEQADYWRGVFSCKWVPVLASKTEGKAHFFDLTVEEDHSYWGDGVVNHNTLSAAVMEVLGLLHLGRDVGHMAAIKGQAQKSQQYLKASFRNPYLRDYLILNNTERTEVGWCIDTRTGDPVTLKQYDALPEAEKPYYERHERYAKVVVCSMTGSNSDHVPFFCIDEVDVIPKQNQQAYEEAKSIPGSFDGKEPITFLTSTRKFAFGNVQREIDAKDKTGLHLRLWNIIDVTQACAPARHKPEEPKVKLYVNKEDLTHLTEEKYEELPPEKRKPYEVAEGFAGCATCPLFVLCKGQLATKQKIHPTDEKGGFTAKPRPLLKSINFTINKLRELTLDMAKAQLACWKPSREGLIYSSLDADKHHLTPNQLIKLLTGEEHQEMTPLEFIRILKQRSGRFVSGVDFGFTHMFSVVLGYVEGPICILIGSWQAPELDPTEKLDLLDRTIKEFDPKVYADVEAPDMIKFLKKHGYKCPVWKKGPGSVIGGIETVRHKLNPTLLGRPELYLLKGAPGIETLYRDMSMYHWEIGQDGNPSDVPDEVVMRTDEGVIGDDSLDAMRYLVMNVFNKGRTGVFVAEDEAPALPTPKEVSSYQEANRLQNQDWARQVFGHVLKNVQETPEEGPQKKGSFFWDM